MLSLISLLSLILSANGITRFVMDDYTIPDATTLEASATASPFPFDVCLNYLVEFGFPLKSYYGIYSCNQAGSEVTFTDYGLDAGCNTIDGTNSKTITYDSSLLPGAVGTFVCDGEDNYVQVNAYTVTGNKMGYDDGGRICCGDAEETYIGVITTTFATEICAPLPENPGLYVSGVCDGDMSGTFTFTDAACMNGASGVDPENTAAFGDCALFAPSDQASVYRMQTKCVYNGTMEEPTAPELNCDPTTKAPTTEPTSNPTVEPTAVTPAPTPAPIAKETDDSKGFTYYINHIALLIIAAAIFVN